MDSALRNAKLDYAPVESLVPANLEGQRTAAGLLSDIKSDVADLDADYLAVKKILPNCRNSEDPQTVAVMRSLLPFLQKEIERGAT